VKMNKQALRKITLKAVLIREIAQKMKLRWRKKMSFLNLTTGVQRKEKGKKVTKEVQVTRKIVIVTPTPGTVSTVRSLTVIQTFTRRKKNLKQLLTQIQ